MVLYFSIPLCWTMHVEVSKIRGTLSVWFSKRDTHRETQRGREREREGEREGERDIERERERGGGRDTERHT